MNASGCSENSAGMARRLIRATTHDTLEELAGEIHLALSDTGTRSFRRPERCAGEDERMEVLGAVAQAMRRSVAYGNRRIASRPEEQEVHLRLLRHLARRPRPKALCLGASGAV
jgi:hypothetical protein